MNPGDNFTPEETHPEKAFAWRLKVRVPADLAGWVEVDSGVKDLEDPSKKAKKMQSLFDGKAHG